MTGWRARLGMLALIGCGWLAHALACAGLPNTPLGMLAFHGSAALLDLLLLYCAPAIVAGRLCDHIEVLCLASMAANFAGWLAYMAYAPPVFYNVCMLGLASAQCYRLLLVDGDHDATAFGRGVVRRPDLGCA